MNREAPHLPDFGILEEDEGIEDVSCLPTLCFEGLVFPEHLAHVCDSDLLCGGELEIRQCLFDYWMRLTG